MFTSDFFKSEKAFRALLPGKIAIAAETLAKTRQLSPREALALFYNSSTYKRLETESTKCWWESPSELCRDIVIDEDQRR